MNDLHHLGVAELAAAIADKKTSSVEAAQHLLARAKQHAGLGERSIEERVALRMKEYKKHLDAGNAKFEALGA